jgi:protein-S-isoprenylcysteine O-methyltransferase Ste14
VLRIPPPLLATAAGFVQARLGPHAGSSKGRSAIAGVVALGAAALAGGAAGRFRKRGTTVDPMRPDSASVLVADGPYSLTRNPMYVGLTGVLLANAVRRGSLVGLLPVVGFVVYIDRLQIAFEEAALRTKFGPEYDAYCASVPRWIDGRSLQALRD